MTTFLGMVKKGWREVARFPGGFCGGGSELGEKTE